MKYLDVCSLFDGEPAEVVFFSTFQFDPEFFERRLLRCETLQKAKRIAVFMDSRQWQFLLSQDVRVRWLNRRYLVVPVKQSPGVFHPKLNLIINGSGGELQCGSNNLTRSGFSSNLELINSIPFHQDDEERNPARLAAQALAFFEKATEGAEDDLGDIISSWIEDIKRKCRWLNLSEQDDVPAEIELIHTYDGSIWDRIFGKLKNQKPKRFFIVSPFHDANGSICDRLSKTFPETPVELLAQKNYTNLPISAIKKLPNFSLSEIYNATGEDASRRVHAKLFAWETENGIGCLSGSANFTSAAFDGKNVEACLLIHDSSQEFERLFDEELSKRPLALDDFTSGSDLPPEDEQAENPLIRLHSVVLTEQDEIRIKYSHKLSEQPDSIRLNLMVPGEKVPRKSLVVTPKSSSMETLSLSANTFSDWHGSATAILTAEFLDGRKINSLPTWIIQQGKLTHDPSGSSSSSKSQIYETGEGLISYLDVLGERDGAAAVADFLRRFNIRFNGESRRFGSNRQYRVRIDDPYQDDALPDWLLRDKGLADETEKSTVECVVRHIKKLKKHAETGNLNGMDNFLDIMKTMIELLYKYYTRGIVKSGHVIGKVTTILEVATAGKDTEKEFFDGYLYKISRSLSGDFDLLQEICSETNFCGNIRAALLLAQQVRFKPGEVLFGKPVLRPKDTLAVQSNMVTDTIDECGLEQPSEEEVRRALEDYQMFSLDQQNALLGEL